MAPESGAVRQSSRSISLTSRSTTILFFLLLCALSDQVTKFAAQESLGDGTVLPLFRDLVYFQLVYNEGGFLGAEVPTSFSPQLLLIAWAGCTLVAVLSYGLFSKAAGSPTILSVALVFGGGASNLVDRFLHGGSAIDFITINTIGLWSVTFNLADLFIIGGFLLLVAASSLARPKRLLRVVDRGAGTITTT